MFSAAMLVRGPKSGNFEKDMEKCEFIATEQAPRSSSTRQLGSTPIWASAFLENATDSM